MARTKIYGLRDEPTRFGRKQVLQFERNMERLERMRGVKLTDLREQFKTADEGTRRFLLRELNRTIRTSAGFKREMKQKRRR